MKTERYISKDIFWTSILLAIFADTKILNLIVAEVWPSLAGVFMTAMYAVVVIGLFVMGMFVQKRSIIKIRKIHIFICLLCILWYFGTVAFVAVPSISFSFFGIFMIAAFLIPGIIMIDMRTFLLVLFILPSVGIFFINQIFFKELLEFGTVSMGTCYALLVPVLGNLVYLRFYYSEENIWLRCILLFFVTINIYYLIQMTMFGSRGPILCVILLLISFFVIKLDDKSKISFRRGRAVCIVLVAIFMANYFTIILQMLSDFLATFNISLNVVDKFIRLGDSGDMTNGREALSDMAWNGIMTSPFWGNGSSQFFNNTGEVYPHNFILQMLYDGGIILTSLVVIPILQMLIHKVNVVLKSEFVCLLFLFFASVPGALFSGDLWNAGLLWMFFGFVLSKNSVFEK